MDLNQLLQDSLQFATKAREEDVAGNFEVAIFFYREAAEAIKKVQDIDKNLGSMYYNNAIQYLDRIDFLHNQLEQGQLKLKRTVSQTDHQKEVKRAEFLLKQALEEDENERPEQALPLYTDAVEFCLEVCKTLTDQAKKEVLNGLAKYALERAEALKGRQPAATVDNTGIGKATAKFSDLGISYVNPKDDRPKLTKIETDVLMQTSFINRRKYPPWIDRDVYERFAYPVPFSDPDGPLALAPKQKQKFSKWVRPGDLCEEPHMIYAVSSLSIRQTVVSDCSFVASLAISAAYERKFKKQLITGVIYPQNKNGKPIINPCGKYMVKLTINGVRRKVVIDDTLPLGKDGQLLCSYSNNSDEFWVSLLEKAYIKVMGGYDFPGSNSNIDLGALTGWIPERFSLKNEEVNKTRMFERMFEGLHRGDVLITVATGFLSEVEAERTGLVPTHAYAVLDIRKIQDLWLLQLKNPWNHLRWKGRFSETDTENWTPDLLRALNYDRREALQNDNGVFWINWESVCRFFDVFYMSWNPKLFQYKFTIHSKWQATKGPIKDSYNIGDNPQYKLTVHSGDSASIVWILLTRHITERDDFADNKEFITVHVYKSPNDNARVYYPDKAYIEGTKINSPHYLTKMQPSKGTQNYTLVISQYEKYNTIFYTLKVYGTVKFELRPVLDPFTSRKRLTGNWTKASAGGSANHASYSSNPKFDLEIISNTPCSLLIKIEAPKQFAVGAEIVSQDGSFKKSSGDYRWGFMAFELQDVPPGRYKIITSTFLPGQESQFFLEIAASAAFNLRKA